ncbi:hypothetical protein [Aliivibrio fischeri]|uniref:hypothetical protein n=1 Tax=Aliivibrio fischeri TaxID=668 RepID=UPI001111BEF1|nr:hypothetical protein [Aliivibrio fischeri]
MLNEFYFNDFTIPLYIPIICVIISFFRCFNLIPALFFGILSIKIIIGFCFDYIIYNSSNYHINCTIIGNVSNYLVDTNKIKLDPYWTSGNKFKSIEHYQLERRFVSIASCSNQEFLKKLMKTKEIKNHLKSIIYIKSGARNKVLHYDLFVENYDVIYESYIKLMRTFFLRRGYEKFIDELSNKGIKNPELLMSSMGFKKRASFFRGYDYIRSSRTLSKTVLFEEITNDFFGKKIKYNTSSEYLKKTYYDNNFEHEYAKIINSLDFNKFETYRDKIITVYKPIAHLNLVLILSSLVIIYSVSSTFSILTKMIIKHINLKIPIKIINPMILSVCIIVFINNLVPTSKFFEKNLFTNSSQTKFVATSLKFHYFLFPKAKYFFIKINIPPWLDTYTIFNDSRFRYINNIKKSLVISMKNKNYTTPIKNSSILNIEQLYYLGEFDDDVEKKLDEIEAYYKDNGILDRLKYIQKKRENYQ